MKHIVAGQVATSTVDFIELTLGTPLELWLGPQDGNETEQERAARLDAARDILAEFPDLRPRRRPRRGRSTRKRAAA